MADRKDLGCLEVVTKGCDWLWGTILVIVSIIIITNTESPLWTDNPVLPLVIMLLVVMTPFASLAVYEFTVPIWAKVLVLALNVAVGVGVVVATFAGAIMAMPSIIPVALNVMMLVALLISEQPKST